MTRRVGIEPANPALIQQPTAHREDPGVCPLECLHMKVQVGLTRFDGHPSSGVRPGRMSDHGEHGEEAPAPSFVHAGVQVRDRGVVPAA